MDLSSGGVQDKVTSCGTNLIVSIDPDLDRVGGNVCTGDCLVKCNRASNDVVISCLVANSSITINSKSAIDLSIAVNI